MPILNNMPTEHTKWGQLKKSKHINEKVIRNLNRFQYRYRLARSFSSMTIDGTTPKTVKGYTVFMKLFLAYSAYDEVRAAEMVLLGRKKLKIHAIKNEKTLAAQLRKNTNLKDLLIKNLENDADALKISLISFFADKSDDVMRIATAARNSFVHGDLTAGGAGLSVNARVDAIENLAKVLMNYCDELFSKCLKRIEAK